jgi:Flp pilus assembly protein TadD
MKQLCLGVAGCLFVGLTWAAWYSRSQVMNLPASNVQCWANASRQNPSDLNDKIMLGYSLEEVGQPDKAEDVYRSILRVSPGFGSARIQLGHILYNRGDHKAARSMWQPVLHSPNSGLRKQARAALAHCP